MLLRDAVLAVVTTTAAAALEWVLGATAAVVTCAHTGVSARLELVLSAEGHCSPRPEVGRVA